MTKKCYNFILIPGSVKKRLVSGFRGLLIRIFDWIRIRIQRILIRKTAINQFILNYKSNNSASGSVLSYLVLHVLDEEAALSLIWRDHSDLVRLDARLQELGGDLLDTGRLRPVEVGGPAARNLLLAYWGSYTV